MKLIDIINKIFGTKLNVVVTNGEQNISTGEQKRDCVDTTSTDRCFVLSYQIKDEYLKDHYIMIKAADEAQATRILLNTHKDIWYFHNECEIEDIIQDSRSDNLMYVEYRDKNWNSRCVAVNADPENVLSIVVEKCKHVKSAGIGKKIEEVIA